MDYELLNSNQEFRPKNISYELSDLYEANTVKYRSLVIDPNNHHLLCVSPYHSRNYEEYMQKYGDEPITQDGQSQFIADEKIEGTMINLFFDARIQKWEIATRSAVGGHYWFYRTEYKNTKSTQKTFYQMFLEALKQDVNADINDLELVKSLPKHYCYSFVLQHVDNRIVYYIQENKVYLVGAFECINYTSNGEDCVYNSMGGWHGNGCWNEMPRIKYINTHSNVLGDIFNDWFNAQILFKPTIYYSYSMIELVKDHVNELESCYPMGIMITNIHDGMHVTYENKRYAELKELRGNNPNLQYHFFALNRIGKTKEFIREFPEYKSLFHSFFKQYRDFLLAIHSGYVQYYILKDKRPIDKKYFVHIAKIHHDVYLPSLASGTKKIITYNVIREYFEKMEPCEILFHINHDARVVASCTA
jgi:hypothetical protein